ncbi:DUF1648 domain-containing protein [Actinopolymorpha pittospori]|uniref:Membrane protein n=1 Tax=Actinopolymorpha pittospori TaxID=648752 RepID=A0A927R8A0_9ACTN|nr:DUF5808 domain-containing protein [Actinopolymorpha pittospori]MBE1605134.1 putative membrane protein [Actinopolymorpha pittospori]
MSVGVALAWAAGSAVVLLLAWSLPALIRPTLQFGVRIPPGHVHDPVIVEQRRTYRRWVLLVGGGLLVASVVVSAVVASPVVGVAPMLVAVLAPLPAYVRAHRAIRAAKDRENWYAGLRQRVAADTSLRTSPPRFPWLWGLPAVLVIVVTLVAGIVRYPHLPSTLITHFAVDGTPDQQVRTSVGSALAFVIVQVALTLLVAGLMVLSFRARPDIDAAAPVTTARQHRGYVVRTTKGLLLLVACVDGSILAGAWQIWDGSRRLSVLSVILPIVLGVVILLAFTIRSGQAGSRLVVDGAPEQDTGVVQRDDDGLWRLGAVYVNREDSAVFVPKRFGIGWTLNLGNPWSLVVLLGIVAVPVLVTVLSATLATR